MFAFERAGTDRPVRWPGLLGLLIIPVVIAGTFLWATWDAGSRLGQVRAAVVNLDEPVTVDDRPVPLGRQLAGGLVGGATERTVAGRALSNISWVLSDEEDAAAGLRDGRYAAVVTIPQSFSAAATSVADAATARQATIDVQTSATSRIADPVIARAVAAVAVDTTNRMLTENYLDQVYVGFNDAREGMEDLADGTGRLADGAGRLADGVVAAGDGSRRLSDGLSQLSAGSPDLRTGGSQLAAGARELSEGLHELDTRLSAEQGMDTGGLGELAAGSARLRDGTAQLRDGAAQLTDGATALDTGLRTYRDAVEGLATQGLVDPATGQPICPPEVQAMGPQACGIFLEGTRAGAGAAAAGLSTPDPATGQTLLDGSAALADGTGRLSAQTGPLADGTAQLDQGIQDLVPALQGLPAQMAQLSSGVHQLAQGAGRLADGTRDYVSGTTRYTEGVDAVAAGAGELAVGMTRLGDGSRTLADGSDELAVGVADGAEQAPTFDAQDRDRLSSVVTRPVGDTQTGALQPASWAALVVGLALWLAGLASFLVLRAAPARALGSAQGSGRLLGRILLPALGLALAQALVVFLVSRSALTADGGRTGALVGFITLVAVTAAVVNHALVLWLGGFGRILSVTCAVLTFVASLSAATPTPLSEVRPFLPLAPAIDGLRNLVLADPAGPQVALLLVWLTGALLACLLGIARRRTTTAQALVARFA